MSEEIKIEICWEAGKITVKLNGEPFTKELRPMGVGKTEFDVPSIYKGYSETPVVEKDKGHLVHRGKTIAIWEKPLNEILAQPLLKSNMHTILRTYYLESKEKTITAYVYEYCLYLKDKGHSVLSERRKRRGSYMRKSEGEKGVRLEKNKVISVYSKPIEEMKAKPNITRNEVVEILYKYHPGIQKDSMITYLTKYRSYLKQIGIVIEKDRTAYRKRGKPEFGISKSKIYKAWVTQGGSTPPGDMIGVVTRVLQRNEKLQAKEIAEATTLKLWQVLATLDVMKEGITRNHTGREVLYSLSEPAKQTTLPAPPMPPATPSDVLINDITKKVALDYDVQFKKGAVREISQFLNSSYQKDFKTATLKQVFRMLLQNHNQVPSWKAYIEYFICASQLEKISWGHYRIIHTTTIPKKKEKLGIIEEVFPDEKDNA